VRLASGSDVTAAPGRAPPYSPGVRTTSIMGNEILRREDPGILRGDSCFVADAARLDLPGAAHLAFTRATEAHARILGVDVRDALAAPGVIAVYTHADLGLGPLPSAMAGLLPESMRRPALAAERVRFVGEPVAVVAAESGALAADAAELVVVETEPLPAVVDPDAARAAGAPLLFGDAGTNVACAFPAGDHAVDLSGCEVVTTVETVNQRLAPAPLEGRAAAAWWDRDHLTHFATSQGAHTTRDALCELLGVRPERVRVVVRDVGGGFGAKGGSSPEELLVAWVAREIGRPVVWSESRGENLLGMNHGRGQRQVATIGGTRDGRITHYRLHVVQDAGAYPHIGAVLPIATRMMASGVYAIRNVEVDTVSVVTNTTPVGAYRGAGRPEAAAAIERAIDVFATEIGLDPADVRRRNLIPPDAFPVRTPTGALYDSGDYAAALDRALAAAGYDDLRHEQARRRSVPAARLLGIGLAMYVEVTAFGAGGEFGEVTLRPDGTVLAKTGSTPFGQGHLTTWAMLVAERMGVPLDAVEVVFGDTDVIPRAGHTGGSRSVQLAGSAIWQAAGRVVDAARAVAAELLEAAPDDLVLDADRGRFHVAGVPAVSVTWHDVASAAPEPLVGLADFEQSQPTFPFGAHVAVVEVDPETGRVELVRFVAVDDAGTIVNPLLAAGQVHGGVAQGIAQALWEGVVYDHTGNPLSASLMDYAMPSAAELPSFERVVQETPTPLNELGAKGIGESGTVGATPAVQNAVVDALAHLGVRHVDMPCTPERVWRAIHGR
jgi:carbon-monoxide dehydrogenase large subunit